MFSLRAIAQRQFPQNISRDVKTFLNLSRKLATSTNISTNAEGDSGTVAKESICDTAFVKEWKKLTTQQREVIRKEWRQKMRETNWKDFTLEEKQALYVMAYGSPKFKDPEENSIVFMGYVIGILASVGLWYIVEYFFTLPQTRARTPEIAKKQEEWLIKHGADPIRNRRQD